MSSFLLMGPDAISKKARLETAAALDRRYRGGLPTLGASPLVPILCQCPAYSDTVAAADYLCQISCSHFSLLTKTFVLAARYAVCSFLAIFFSKRLGISPTHY